MAERARDIWELRPPTEKHVVVFFDPRADLQKRAERWSHDLTGLDLSSLALFAAGLAEAESVGWASDARDVATRAYEDRRFLLSDRVLHWAVPWLGAVEREFRTHQDTARTDREFMLQLAEEMRLAPEIEGTEGLILDGHDSLGPTAAHSNLDLWTSSLWSGDLVLNEHRSPVERYEEAAERWDAMASTYPASAQLWRDLSRRAVDTAALVRV